MEGSEGGSHSRRNFEDDDKLETNETHQYYKVDVCMVYMLLG